MLPALSHKRSGVNLVRELVPLYLAYNRYNGTNLYDTFKQCGVKCSLCNLLKPGYSLT